MGDTMDLMDMLEHKDKSLDERVELAEKGDKQDLDYLVDDEDYRVRELVANHGMAKHLNILIHDSNPIVRGEVAANKRKKDLEILRWDDEPSVRNYALSILAEEQS